MVFSFVGFWKLIMLLNSRIILLLFSIISICLQKSDTGSTLLDVACQHLDIVEKDYFGLRFMDVNKHRVIFSQKLMFLSFSQN